MFVKKIDTVKTKKKLNQTALRGSMVKNVPSKQIRFQHIIILAITIFNKEIFKVFYLLHLYILQWLNWISSSIPDQCKMKLAIGSF